MKTPKEKKSEKILKRYYFEINCEGMIRSTTIISESKSEAEKIAKRGNPNCNVLFKWVHDE